MEYEIWVAQEKGYRKAGAGEGVRMVSWVGSLGIRGPPWEGVANLGCHWLSGP